MPKGRALESQLLLGLALLAGCATTPPAEPPDTLPLPPEESPAASIPVPSVAPARSDEASSVNGAAGLVALCESMRDEAGLSFPGNAVQQARAVEAHARRREAALAGRYVTIIPASGFAFRNYDIGSKRLLLDTEGSLVLGDGAELFATSQDPAPGFVLAPDLADRLLTQRAQDKVALRLIFRPVGSELRKDACMWLGGGRVVKMEIEILGAALVAPNGTVLSRGDTGEYADTSSAFPVRSPKVTVNKPRTTDGKDVQAGMASAMRVLAEAAQPCYERVLRARPTLRGTLVLAIRVGPAGRVASVHVEMSSLADDATVHCVVANAAKATIAGASSGQRFSVPLQFASAEER
jgi:hypothetical protein